MKKCNQCGAEQVEETQVCSACGDCADKGGVADIPEKTTAAHKQKKNWVVALWITIGMVAVIAVASALMIKMAGFFEEDKVAFSDDPAAISAASPSVVMLNCYDQSGELFATGSGFAFFQDGVIVTNYHVIDEEVYRVKASTEEGASFALTWILAYDEEKDIAILGTDEATNLKLLQPGASQALQKGEKVVAIGSPLGLMNSVSSGVFSAYVQEGEMNTLQFTAAISSGSSGGALFNDAGEVLGITYASYEGGQNINLAVPIEEVSALWTTRTDADRQTVADFYEGQIHTYSVQYVIENYEKLLGRTFYVEGWVFSHRSYQYPGNDLLWCGYCTLYNSVDDFPPVKLPEAFLYEAAFLEEYNKLCVFIKDSTLFEPLEIFENVQTGDYMCIKAMVREDETEQNNIITLYSVEEKVKD